MLMLWARMTCSIMLRQLGSFPSKGYLKLLGVCEEYREPMRAFSQEPALLKCSGCAEFLHPWQFSANRAYIANYRQKES